MFPFLLLVVLRQHFVDDRVGRIITNKPRWIRRIVVDRNVCQLLQLAQCVIVNPQITQQGEPYLNILVERFQLSSI